MWTVRLDVLVAVMGDCMFGGDEVARVCVGRECRVLRFRDGDGDAKDVLSCLVLRRWSGVGAKGSFVISSVKCSQPHLARA